MGHEAMTGIAHAIIDESFAGLSAPAEIHEVGRPDITDDRPGVILVDAVRKFQADGGFKKIALDRQEARAAAEEADKKRPREALPDFSLPQNPGETKDLGASKVED